MCLCCENDTLGIVVGPRVNVTSDISCRDSDHAEEYYRGYRIVDADTALRFGYEPGNEVNVFRRHLSILIVGVEISDEFSNASYFFGIGHFYVAHIDFHIPVRKHAAHGQGIFGCLRNGKRGLVDIPVEIPFRIDISGMDRHRGCGISADPGIGVVIRVYYRIFGTVYRIEICIERRDIDSRICQRRDGDLILCILI